MAINKTIDDADTTQVTYSPTGPNGPWNDQDCDPNVCSIHPSKAIAFDGTWHEVTYHTGNSEAAVQFSFEGPFCIVLRCGVLVYGDHL